MTADDMNSPADEALARALAEALRRSEDVDAVTAARLSAARKRAVAAVREPRTWFLNPAVFLPTGALAAALLVVLVLPREQVTSEAAPVNVAELEAFDLLTDEEEPEFYRDLDFYEWLEAVDGHA